MSFMDNLYASPLAPGSSSSAAFPSSSFLSCCRPCTPSAIDARNYQFLAIKWKREQVGAIIQPRGQQKGREREECRVPAVMRFKLILLPPLWGYMLSRMSISISFSYSFSLCNASFGSFFSIYAWLFYIFFHRLQSCQLGDKVLHKYIFLVAAAHCALTDFLYNFLKLQPLLAVVSQWPPVQK